VPAAFHRLSAIEELLKPRASGLSTVASFLRRSIGMTGALLLWRFHGINEKESAMSTSSLIRSSSQREFAHRSGRQVAANSSQSKLRGSIHFEDVVATVSLAALSTAVLTLVYQSMVP
jgi:hypothetical protein